MSTCNGINEVTPKACDKTLLGNKTDSTNYLYLPKVQLITNISIFGRYVLCIVTFRSYVLT